MTADDPPACARVGLCGSNAKSFFRSVDLNGLVAAMPIVRAPEPKPAQQRIHTGRRRRVEGPALASYLTTGPDTLAGGDRFLAHIQAGNPLMHQVHRSFFHTCAAGVGTSQG